MPSKKLAPAKANKTPAAAISSPETAPTKRKTSTKSSKSADPEYRYTNLLSRKKLFAAAQYKLSSEDNGEDMSDLYNRLLFHYVTGNIKELRSSPTDYTKLGF